MKKSVIVITDFSESAANSLTYACKFASDYNLNILLVHIFTIPIGYAAEGLSLATIEDILNADEERLQGELNKMYKELNRLKNKHTHVHIEAKMITGDFLESLQELTTEMNPELIIMGSRGKYAESSFWDHDWLNSLIMVSCPILVIPQHIAYSPILRIAFAADNKNSCSPAQIDTIKKIVLLSEANFHIVHVSTPSDRDGENNKAYVYNEVFTDIDPQYITVENKSVVRGIAEFIQQYFIDLLIVIPHKHSLWYNLFNKSYTKQLALLNHIPVLVIHDSG